MNVSLPDELKDYVDSQVRDGGFGSTSEYVRDLIRRDRARGELRAAILEGLASPVVATSDDDFFGDLRRQLGERS